MVTIVPFEEVTESLAEAESEVDKSLCYWREAHWAYFSREGQRLGIAPSLRLPVACEQFD